MYIYAIVVKNVPAERLHYTLRDSHAEWCGATHYDPFLSVTGRLTGHKGAAYFPTPDMAQAVLSYFQSKLEARKYGDACTFVIKQIHAYKWDLRRMDKTLLKLQSLPGFKDLPPLQVSSDT